MGVSPAVFAPIVAPSTFAPFARLQNSISTAMGFAIGCSKSMRHLFHTVRSKLTALVALPLLLTSVALPILFSALHGELLNVADDHVEDAYHAFQEELEDDTRDLTLALRMIASHPASTHAIDTDDAADAIVVAQTFAREYPNLDIILAQRDGRILANVGPTHPPANLRELPEFAAFPKQGEAYAVLPNGCSSPTVHSPPALTMLGAVGARGFALVCCPLDKLFLENASHKLGIQLALFDGVEGKELSAKTDRFPVPALQLSKSSVSLLAFGNTTWAVKRFDPKLDEHVRGAKLVAVGASDVGNITRSVYKNLGLAICIILIISVIAVGIGIRIASTMSRTLHRVIGAFKRFQRDQQLVHVPVIRSEDELEWLATGFNQMVDGLLERDKLRATLGKYLTESVVEHLLAGKIELGGETLTVTILFTDIRSFTSISENMDAQTLVSMLNEYFTEMVGIVLKNHGVVDKYIGDAIMAVFGAPVPRPDDAQNAVRAAVEMRAALKKLNVRLTSKGMPALKAGIGIHTGEAVAGNIGSEQRMEYTVIGDTVNLASRLESCTKELDATILISEATYESTKALIQSRAVKQLTVKGRAKSVMTYEVLGLRETERQAVPAKFPA